MATRTRRMRHNVPTAPSQQQGIVAIIVTIAMLVLLAAGAMALDVGNSILHKTRLQSAVDAAALAGAKVLNANGDELDATIAARAAFQRNADANGNKKLKEFYDGGGLVEVQFSATLYPFDPGTAPAEYVRARVSQMPLDIFLAGVVGVTDSAVSAAAISGPSPALGPDSLACNVAPMMVCGDPANPAGTFFGYTIGDIQVLKTSTDPNKVIGPGNFQLIRLDDGQGGAEVREAMAGGYDACQTPNDDIETEPGNTIGPVAQGLNTRFGQYNGPMNKDKDKYPPDVVVTENTVEIQFDADGNVTTQPSELDFNYDDYQFKISSNIYDNAPPPAGNGAFDRRIMALPIGDCTNKTNGHDFIPLLGYGCFFVLQQVSQQGNEADIYGQFVESCKAGGVPGRTGNGNGGVGPYIIQLYEDPSSTDS